MKLDILLSVCHTDGTVDLTVRAGKVISKKLGIRNE